MTDGMQEYCGKICTIKSIDANGFIKIEEDYGMWYWTKEMLDIEPINLLEVGTRVTTRDGAQYIIIHKYENKITLLTRHHVVVCRFYTNQLTTKDLNTDKDIVTIEKVESCDLSYFFNAPVIEVVYKCELEPKEMTIADIEKELGYTIKIIK